SSVISATGFMQWFRGEVASVRREEDELRNALHRQLDSGPQFGLRVLRSIDGQSIGQAPVHQGAFEAPDRTFEKLWTLHRVQGRRRDQPLKKQSKNCHGQR